MRLLDPHNAFGEQPEEELAAASATLTPEQRETVPERSILVAPQSAAALDQLLALAEPLARSEPRRELILVRLVRPPRGAAVRGGLQTEARLVSEAAAQVQDRRQELLDAGLAARAVALTSADAGRDLTRLCRDEDVDLVLIDGRRPLLGDGVPREEVGTVLGDAPCDVAVLVAREGVEVSPGPDRSVMVPFGGADHDWAALELAAWIAAASGAPLQLLGSSGQRRGRPRRQRSAGERLADRAAVRGGRRPSRSWPSPVATASSPRPREPGCCWSASPSAGARRAWARPAGRSPVRLRRRSSSSGGASGPAPSLPRPS